MMNKTILSLLGLGSLALAQSSTVTISAPENIALGNPVKVVVHVTHEQAGQVVPLEHSYFSASFRIGFRGREFLYTRFRPGVEKPNCAHDPSGRFPDRPTELVAVEKGQTEEVVFPILLPKAGVYDLKVEYRGHGADARVAPVISNSVTVTVAPSEVFGLNIDELSVEVETNMGSFILGFWPEEALGTVLNFIHLADSGFYDGVGFHRIIDGFMSQGGDPKGTGEGGPGYTIPHELNARSHSFGVISMARSANLDSAGSQFFVCAEKASFLDRQYTAFGHTVSGLNVVQKINDVGSDDRNGVPPRQKVTIAKARVCAFVDDRTIRIPRGE